MQFVSVTQIAAKSQLVKGGVNVVLCKISSTTYQVDILNLYTEYISFGQLLHKARFVNHITYKILQLVEAGALLA